MPDRPCRKDRTAAELVHKVIRDEMEQNAVSRHHMARAFIAGAHDLEVLSTGPEKAAAGEYMRLAAEHLKVGRGWLLFNHKLEAPFAMPPSEKAQCSIATARESCSRHATDLAIALMRVGHPAQDAAAGLIAAARAIDPAGSGCGS